MVSALTKLACRLRDFLVNPLLQRNANIDYPDAASQIQLQLTYRALLASRAPLPRLSEIGFKVFSQTDEDGMLLYIFSVIGSGGR